MARRDIALLIAVGVALAALVGSSSLLVAQEAPKRPAWTTSRVIGSPEPAPSYKPVQVFPNAKFFHPLLITRAPGTDRLFIGEQDGKIFSIRPQADAKPELVVDLAKSLRTIDQNPGAKGLEYFYGLAFHPQFAKNRTCYICYTLRGKDGGPNLAEGTRVSRFQMKATEPPVLDVGSEEILLTFLQGGHNGGDLHFGPDGMLYISTGDAASPNPPDALNTGQDCSDLLSSVLRIDVDHRDPGKNYAIPKDNPFVGKPEIRPEIWAYGFRNPWRMSFDRKTGELWLGDVGWELWEMVHRIARGGNYGWSMQEASQRIKPNQPIGPTPIRPPMIELPHTIAASVTGGYVYRGQKFPELVGSYIFGDWQTRRLWAARFDGDRLISMPELTKPTVRVVAFGEDHAGELYFLDYDTGLVYTLERNDAAMSNAKFPQKLSETGLFTNLDSLTPAAGVFPFSPNARQFHDGAEAEYLVAIPGNEPLEVYPFGAGKPITGQADWFRFRTTFPTNAVLVKTLTFGRNNVNRRRVETQLLHFDGDDWRAYTYAWRDDQRDADLIGAEGEQRTIRLPGPQPSSMRWTFHSRNQCLTCHNPWAGTVLGFEPGQLHDGGQKWGQRPDKLSGLLQANIIRWVNREGKPLPAAEQKTPADEAIIYSHDSASTSGTPEQQARGYLHANCAHCHRFGGGGGATVMELDARKPTPAMGVRDAMPRLGDFGISNARIVVDGAPERSILFWRMAKFGPGHMPRLGSESPDYYGTELIRNWITNLAESKGQSTRAKWSAPDSLTAPTDAVQAYALGLRLPALRSRWEAAKNWTNPEASQQLMKQQFQLQKVIEAMPAGLSRDLIEGHLPVDPDKRKLGPNPSANVILALSGDAQRGERIFLRKELKCATCHKLGDQGVAIGPELTAIGKSRSRTELLESLLEPSKRIEPAFASYVVKTIDGRVFTGIMVQRSEKELVLRDTENKLITVASGEVETVQPSRISLMPEGLLGGLTAQEAVDLLKYLESRR